MACPFELVCLNRVTSNDVARVIGVLGKPVVLIAGKAQNMGDKRVLRSFVYLDASPQS
jgi:hypothetical protein